ncbi:MAG: ribokinase [Clostridia bacterium]|nr:ribokinase [Clostridia bacterium]
MGKNVLVVGSINVDYVIHTDRIPKLGETLTGKDFAMNFGGKGANQAVALAKVGCNVKMLGAVGKDLSADLAVQNLQSFGIDCTDVLRVDTPTGAAVITVCHGDNHIILDGGANDCVTPERILECTAAFDWADVLVMQYEIPTESVLCAVRLAKERGKTVLLNPAPVKDVDSSLYGFVDLILPNEFEAGLITGIEPTDRESAENVIRALRALGCGNAVVTLGSRGCAYSEGEKIGFAGIYPVKAVDTTAAGDSFIGGLCSKLCEGWSMSRAVSYASAVSAITVSRPGAGVSIPTATEVEEFLREHKIAE